MALGGVALLSGCKGNTRAADIEGRAGKPPVVAARGIEGLGDAGRADPLSDKIWRAAEWRPLAAPANTTRTTPPSRMAALYDAGTLYVAVINALPEGEAERDAVSLYIDTYGEGKEVLEVTADARGETRCTWIRSSVPVGPREDGSPNTGYPLDVRPDLTVAGLEARVRAGMEEGRAIWTVVFAVPAAGMPALMQVMPAAGGHWKFNVLRTVTRGGEVYQGNLAPVYVNAQAVSAYRMAELEFVGMTHDESMTNDPIPMANQIPMLQ